MCLLIIYNQLQNQNIFMFSEISNSLPVIFLLMRQSQGVVAE